MTPEKEKSDQSVIKKKVFAQPKQDKIHIHSRVHFPLTEEDYKKGIEHLRKKVVSIYRGYAKQYHPDNKTKRKRKKSSFFRCITREYKYLLKLIDNKTIFCSYDNFDKVLEITKGYKTKEDYPEIFG